MTSSSLITESPISPIRREQEKKERTISFIIYVCICRVAVLIKYLVLIHTKLMLIIS